MKRCILLKYGEIVLKGQNKSTFEAVLLKRIRRRLSHIGSFTVESMQSTVYIYAEDESSLDLAFERVKTVFGISSLCIALVCEKDMDTILKTISENADRLLLGAKSFKAQAKRSDKKFPFDSMQIARAAGDAVCSVLPSLPVDVISPDVILSVEIRDKYAFIHAGSSKGAGGMPVGTSGNVLLLLSGGIDSPVAGYMMARRGALVEAIHFESYPYTSERALMKTASLAQKLCEYTDSIRMNIISLTDIQMQIKKNCNADYFTLLLRRFMMRLSCRLAREHGLLALVTGESLAQVASQTLESIAVTDSVCDIPVFRPCIGMDKDDIVAVARKIDTFETSILPYEDCCTIFTPKHPKTKPTLDGILREEAKLDIDRLEDEAFNKLYYKIIRYGESIE